MKALAKPIGSTSNIAILGAQPSFLRSIDNSGWRVSRWAYESRPYRDTIPELYNNEYIEIPYPLLYRLARNGISQKIQWTPGAWAVYTSALERHENVAKIKRMDMDFIHSFLLQNGVDPAVCLVRANSADVTSGKPFRDHQYQALALYIATQGRCANFGQMRTGKTPPTILYAYMQVVQKNVDCVLVVVPNHIKWIWKEEILKVLPDWVSSLTAVVEGTKSNKRNTWNSYEMFYIVNYESFRADIDIATEVFKDKRVLLILDECHAIKNADTKQSRAARSFPSEQVILLSGTPVANKPQDIFIPAQLIAPHLLAFSEAHFKSAWAYTDTYGNVRTYRKQWFRKENGTCISALDEIHSRLAVVSCRVLRKDVDLEIGKIIQPQMLEMNEQLKKIYEQAKDQFRLELSSSTNKTSLFISSFLARIVRLQQLTDGYLPKLGKDGTIEKYLWLDSEFNIPNAKIQFIDNWVDEYLEDVEKLVIYSRFVPVLDRLYSRYKKHGARLIYGQTYKHDISRFMAEFKTDPEVRVMLCNTVCAEGKDFNPCNFVFFYDRVWGLKDNTQAEDRVTGMLQTKESTIMPLIIKDTIDQKLEFVVLPKKRADAAKIEDGVGVSESYTMEDLYDLLS